MRVVLSPEAQIAKLMKYRAEIDGLRAIAVVPVILFHGGSSILSGGYVGVDVFFVISGYLISTLILDEREAGTFSIVHFYERRIRRIIPALLFVIFCTMPFAWFYMYPNELEDFAESVISINAFVSNVYFFFNSGYFDTRSEFLPLLHTWSLSIEEQFYIVFPALLLLMPRRRFAFLFIFLLIGALLSFALTQFGGNLNFSAPYINADLSLTAVPDFGFFFIVTRAWELLVGCLVAVLFKWRSSPKTGNDIAAGLGLLMILYGVFFFDQATPYPSVFTALPVVGTALIIMFANADTLTGRFISNRVFVAIGLISYSMYLWHQPIYAYLRLSKIGPVTAFEILSVLVASLIAGYFSWRYVERPFRDKEQFSRRQIFVFAALGVTACSTIGVVAGPLSHGLPGRADSTAFKVIEQQIVRNEEIVWGPVNRIAAKEIDPDRPNVVVVGDSFSAELVGYFEDRKEFLNKYNLVHFYIPHSCLDEFFYRAAHFGKPDANCRRDINIADLQRIIGLSNTVLFHFNWNGRSADGLVRLEESFLHEPEKAIVVGPKEVHLPRFWMLKNAEPAFFETSEETRNKISRMKSQLSKLRFYDLQAKVCLEENRSGCPVFDSSGSVIALDRAGHLSVEGREYLFNRTGDGLLGLIDCANCPREGSTLPTKDGA